MPRRLVLFDIDGTILHGGKLFRECFEGAFRSRFDREELPRVSFSGKTDRQICRELMQVAGLLSGASEAEREASIDAVIHEYLSRVRAAMPGRASEVKILPGVQEVLARLESHSQVLLGLLTGNVREGARLKLTAVGVHQAFRFGVYGDDHWDRYQLPSIAVAQVRRDFGIEFKGKQIVIIGDTIHDVNCGRSLGVRSIGVGTGQPDQRVKVLEASPDYFFNDLSDTDAVVRAILESENSSTNGRFALDDDGSRFR